MISHVHCTPCVLCVITVCCIWKPCTILIFESNVKVWSGRIFLSRISTNIQPNTVRPDLKLKSGAYLTDPIDTQLTTK